MSIKHKLFASAATLTLVGGVGLASTAGTAQASSTGCAFSNGCATLHGVDVASNAVAMDAKRQSSASGTLIIGYPDIPNDGATSFDAVLHYTSGGKVTSYADTGFQLSPTFTSIPCDLTTDPTKPPNTTTVPGQLTADGTGNVLTVESTTGTATASPTSGASLTLGGIGTITVGEQYASDGASCVASYTGTVSGSSIGSVTGPDTARLTFPTSPGGSTWTFLDSDSGGKFSFTGLPAGISVSGGSLTADTSTATPGIYTNVGVTYTAADGAVFTATFTLTISAVKSVNPGTPTPYYTFVYAKGGVWSNECVTDTNGSGALTLETCTLGRDLGQDFYALAGTPVTLGVGAYSIQNRLALITDAADSCLTDPSSLNPATRQTDATDETVSPAGRQLRVNGSCLMGVNPWTWAS